MSEPTASIEALVVECVTLRHECYFPTRADSPAEMLDRLHRTRQSLDRVEQILVMLTRLRGRAAIVQMEAIHSYDAAWDHAAQNNHRSNSVRDVFGPRERYAEFNLSALKEARAKHQAETRHKEIDVAVDAVRLIHRGLDGLRNDLHVVLRALNVETRLEA